MDSYRYAFWGQEDRIEAAMNLCFKSDEVAGEVGIELLSRSPYQSLDIWNGRRLVLTFERASPGIIGVQSLPIRRAILTRAQHNCVDNISTPAHPQPLRSSFLGR